MKNIIKKSTLKQIIKEIISEVDGDISGESQATDVTFTVKGPSGENTFVLPVEAVKSLSDALTLAIGSVDTTSTETPEDSTEEPVDGE